MKCLFFILVLLSPCLAIAGDRFAIGPESGFGLQSHRDPTGSQTVWASGVPFGLAGVYQFSRDLSAVALDYSIGYVVLPRLTYRNVAMEGLTGTYRENLGLFYWLSGLRYYFTGYRWRPFGGLGCGFQYFWRSDVEFRDRFNTVVPIPPPSNHFNFTLAPQVGIEFRPTFRWAVGFSARFPISFRTSGMVPAVQFPLTVQVAF